MTPDGRLGDEQALRDAPGRETLAQAVENLPLAARQIALAPTGEARPPCPFPELVAPTGGERARQRGLAAEGSTTRAGQVLPVHLLEGVAGGARLESCEEVGICRRRAQHDDLRLRQLRPD